MDEIKRTLDKLQREQESALKEAYELGFAAGVAITPDHEKFHSSHQEPKDYGEDGEIYVLSGKFDEDEALEKFVELFKREGFEYEDVEIHRTKIALATDTTDEYEYFYHHNGTGIFDAWAWTA